MEIKNETVEDVANDVNSFQCDGLLRADRVKFITSDIARRFKEAHERDVSELVQCLKEAVGDKMGTYTMKGIEVGKWSSVIAKHEKESGCER